MKTAELDGTVKQDSEEIDMLGMSTPTSAYSAYMGDEDAFATILYKITKNQFGEECESWELDVLTESLRERYPNIPDVNLDKIMSIIAMNHSFDGSLCFFNELNCFSNTVNAFNGLEPDYEFLGALVPQHIYWCMFEMGEQYPGYKLHEEPAKFLGLCFHTAGYLVLPEGLSEYQEFLNYYNKNSELVPMIKSAWSKKKKKPSTELDSEGIVDLQVLMLKANETYMNYRKKQYLKDMVYYK